MKVYFVPITLVRLLVSDSQECSAQKPRSSSRLGSGLHAFSAFPLNSPFPDGTLLLCLLSPWNAALIPTASFEKRAHPLCCITGPICRRVSGLRISSSLLLNSSISHGILPTDVFNCQIETSVRVSGVEGPGVMRRRRVFYIYSPSPSKNFPSSILSESIEPFILWVRFK